MLGLRSCRDSLPRLNLMVGMRCCHTVTRRFFGSGDVDFSGPTPLFFGSVTLIFRVRYSLLLFFGCDLPVLIVGPVKFYGSVSHHEASAQS